MRRAGIALALPFCLAAGACRREPPNVARPPDGDIATILTTREQGTASIVADARDLYIATWHALKRVDKGGKAVVDIHAAPLGGILPGTFAADENELFFAVRDACPSAELRVDVRLFATSAPRAPECTRVMAVPKDGGGPRLIVALEPDVEPVGLAVGARGVCWGQRVHLMCAPRAGGAPQIALTAESPVQDVAIARERLFWIEGNAPEDARLMTLEPTGEKRAVGHADAGRTSIAFDGRWIYWPAAEKVWRAEVRGGAAEALGEAHSGEPHLALDGGTLVWTEWAAGDVAVRAAGGGVRRVQLRNMKPDHVAIDARAIYATAISEEDGTTRVVRIAR